MSRRHLTFVVVAIASLFVGACNASPTSPRPSAASHDEFETPTDSSGRIGTSGAHG
jgi:hypothetical protein